MRKMLMSRKLRHAIKPITPECHILGELILALVLAYVFRNNTVQKKEADASNPPKFFGMYLYPKRHEGEVKIPWWAVILKFAFFAVVIFFYI